jgi:aldose 1-epimerase
MKLVALENDLFRCSLVPDVGGAIYSFDLKVGDKETQPLLRHTAKTETTDVLDLASWPLVPFSNRIKYGAFSFEGKDYTIGKSYLGGPNGIHASHGQGWQFPWQVDEAKAERCVLSFAFDPARAGMAKLWPFAYEAQQVFALHDNGMTQRLSVTNTGKVNMPCGLGTHPYFPKVSGTTLQAVVKGLWEIDEEVIPVRQVEVPPEYDFRRPKALDTAKLDSCFSGYGGLMQIVWPGRAAALNVESSANLDHYVVYTPMGEDFFCAEPVSHKPNAVNDAVWSGNGLIVLKPGETQEVSYRYEALRMPSAPSSLARLRAQQPLDLG